MSNVHDQFLLMEGSSLPQGYNYTIHCPDCGHNSLSIVNKPDAVAYHCWRASCGISGYVRKAGIVHSHNHEQHKPELNPYTGPMLKPDVLGAAVASNVYTNGKDKYLLPILDPKGMRRGMVERVPWGKTDYVGPKSKIYKEKHEPMISWYGSYGIHSVVAVVEDQLSAIRLAQTGSRACALLGTELDADKIAEIQAEARYVLLALDADATAKAFRLARKWASAFKSFRVIILTKDVKDMSDEEIRSKFA